MREIPKGMRDVILRHSGINPESVRGRPLATLGISLRALGLNPRALGTNPRARRRRKRKSPP
jgi:hypothetical protein